MLKVAAIIFAICTSYAPEAFSSEVRNENESIDKANGRRRGALRNRNRNHRRNRNHSYNRNHRRDRNHSYNRNYRRDRNREINRSHNRYRRYNHVPYRYDRSHHRNWYNSGSFWRRVPRNYVYRDRWLRWNYNYRNGYHWYNNYPWFVYNNFLHRYSDTDNCNYELVDSFYDEVIDRFHSMSCRIGYDKCARVRDDWNWEEREERYFCSETRNDYY